MNKNHYDIIIIGAGAAGLMCAAFANKIDKKILVIEHTNNIGEKIRISGGGRCNFTNLHVNHNKYISNNPEFVKFALQSYTQYDFIKLVEKYKIAYHEKTLGQLFCDNSSKQIINMLIEECKPNVSFSLNTVISEISKADNFNLETSKGSFASNSLVMATGGLSIPKLGASDFGYRIAKQFNIKIIQTKPALVPFTVDFEQEKIGKDLAGISVDSICKQDKISFRENILFTHKGLSGPAILQISSYIREVKNHILSIDLSPQTDVKKLLIENRNSKLKVTNLLKTYLPKRFIDNLAIFKDIDKKIAECKNSELEEIAEYIHSFKIQLSGTEGYNKAEVTLGGVDTDELFPNTMESKKIPGLYFIGEIVDVTGWLGGYNFQWAWSSAFIAAQSISNNS
ncbi:MAG: NAD(P)/FAD-dependent oxidoreductase [Alphaproteobacteria bacterium]